MPPGLRYPGVSSLTVCHCDEIVLFPTFIGVDSNFDDVLLGVFGHFDCAVDILLTFDFKLAGNASRSPILGAILKASTHLLQAWEVGGRIFVLLLPILLNFGIAS